MKITHRYANKTLFMGDYQSMMECLSAAVASGANLDGAILTRARLDGAILTRARLVNARLDGAILTRAILDGVNLDGANLYGAILDGANLVNANLDGANLTRAILDGANLTRARLDGANLYGAILDGANLDGANLTRANLDGAILDDKTFVAQFAFSGHGERGRMLVALKQGDAETMYRCGCFYGSREALDAYIAEGDVGLAKSRRFALECCEKAIEISMERRVAK